MTSSSARNFKSQASQLGNTSGHVLEQQRSHVLAVERSPPRQTLEQYRPRRIQIGRLSHAVLQRAGLLRRAIAGRLHRFLVAQQVRRHDPRQIEPDKHHPVLRPSFRDNQIGGADVAVKDLAGVNLLERRKEAIADLQHFGDFQRPLLQQQFQRNARNERANDVYSLLFTAKDLCRRRMRDFRGAEHGNLALQLELHVAGERFLVHELDDHRRAARGVDRQQRLDVLSLLESAYNVIAIAASHLRTRARCCLHVSLGVCAPTYHLLTHNPCALRIKQVYVLPFALTVRRDSLPRRQSRSNAIRQPAVVAIVTTIPARQRRLRATS